jgi:hypothetical protein
MIVVSLGLLLLDPVSSRDGRKLASGLSNAAGRDLSGTLAKQTALVHDLDSYRSTPLGGKVD